MKDNQRWGGVLASAGAVIGIAGHFLLFDKWYEIGMHAESAEPGCEILLKYIHPLMADAGLLGAVLFAVAAFGFFTRRDWAFPLTTGALVLSLLGSWFVNVPFMAAGLPPVYFPLFWPYVGLYFVFTVLVAKVPWRRVLLGLLTGIAYIFCWMNGTASTSRIITMGSPIFVLVQRLHYLAMLGMAAVTIGVLLRPAEWVRVLGLTSAAAEVVVGVPLAYVTARLMSRFSMFALAPISCALIILMLARTHVWERWTRPAGYVAPPAPSVTAPWSEP